MLTVWLPGGVRTEVHLTGEDTGGAFCLLCDEPPEGWQLPPHRHINEAETIHVVSGRFWIDVDGERHELGPGETIHIHAGVPHSGGTLEPGRRVIAFSPAGLEHFFLTIGTAAADDPVDVEAVIAAAARYGFEFG